MPRTKKLALVLLCLLVAGLAVFFTLVPTRTSTTGLTLSILEHKTDSSMSQAFVEAARPPMDAGAVFDGVYLVERDYLLGGTTTTLFAPYLTCDAQDVGTAGTSNWAFRLNVLALAWKNGNPVESRPVDVSDAALTVTADANTALFHAGSNTSGEKIPLDNQSRQEDGSYTVSLRAATLNSAVAPNAACTATITCTGALTSRGIRFDLSSQVEYINNLS